jgi:hypothetical protein
MKGRLVFLASLAFGALFLWSGIAKIKDPISFAEAIRNYRIVGDPIAPALAHFLPWLEVFAGFAVMWERMRQGAAGSNFMPRDRPSSASFSLISVRDFLPKLRYLSISASVFMASWPTVVMLALLRQLAARTESSISLTLMLRSLRARRFPRSGLPGRPRTRRLVVVVDEHVEVVAQDGGGLEQGVVRADAAVGPDVEHELVVVGVLADAGVFHGVLHAGDGE